MTLPRLFEKANRTLLAAKRALEQGDAETTADRAYYSIYYAAWGLLAAAGVPRPKTHNGLIAELSRVYVKTGKLDATQGAVLSRLQNLRLVADYSLEVIPLEDARRAVREAEQFLAAARALGESPR